MLECRRLARDIRKELGNKSNTDTLSSEKEQLHRDIAKHLPLSTDRENNKEWMPIQEFAGQIGKSIDDIKTYFATSKKTVIIKIEKYVY